MSVRSAITDAVLMMRARPVTAARSRSAGIAARHSRNTARTLTAKVLSHCASVVISPSALADTPALLNRMSSWPPSRSAAATMVAAASSVATSCASATMRGWSAWALAMALVGRSTAITSAPS